jgi:hypothetical protein
MRNSIFVRRASGVIREHARSALALAIVGGVSVGCMISPGNGATDERADISTITLGHNGFHIDPDASIALQILTPPTADPSDAGAWKTYGTAQSGTQKNYIFSGDTPPNGDSPLYQWSTSAISPIQGVTSRWPQGGVARIRAATQNGTYMARIFDDNFLSCPTTATHYTDFSTQCGSYTSYAVLVSGTPTPADNPSPPAARWLTDGLPDPDQANTKAYYAAIGAAPGGELANLTTFKSTFGFGSGGDEASAVYYNNGDLGLGRAMRCRTSGARRACLVTNYADRDGQGHPIFGGGATQQQDAITQAIGGTNPIATVAMVYDGSAATNQVKFVVYDPGGNPQPFAALDNHSAKNEPGSSTSVPKNCIACHGGAGSYDPGAKTVTGAHFLPFDPGSFVFSTSNNSYTLAAQQAAFQKLNAIVYAAGATDTTQKMLQAIYGSAGAPQPGQVANPAAIPAGWADNWNEKQLYTNVVAPYCRTCHVSRTTSDPFSFSTYAQFASLQSSIVSATCGAQIMPHAEQTQRNFWSSGARSHLLAWSGASGDCSPH